MDLGEPRVVHLILQDLGTAREAKARGAKARYSVVGRDESLGKETSRNGGGLADDPHGAVDCGYRLQEDEVRQGPGGVDSLRLGSSS